MRYLQILLLIVILSGCHEKDVYTYRVSYITPITPDIQYRYTTFDTPLNNRDEYCFVNQEMMYIETILRQPIYTIWVDTSDNHDHTRVKHFECQ